MRPKVRAGVTGGGLRPGVLKGVARGRKGVCATDLSGERAGVGGGRRSTPTRSITTRQGWRDPNTTASAYHAQGTCLISRDKIGTCPERPAWACARCEKKNHIYPLYAWAKAPDFFSFLHVRTTPPLSACHAPEHCAYLNSESPTVLQEAISYEPIFFGQHVSSHVFQR